MNSRLKRLPDGSGNMHAQNYKPVFFRVASDAGPSSPIARSGEIYWPFALEWDIASDPGAAFAYYDITHLPSGYSLCKYVKRRRALALIKALRELATVEEWEFTQPTAAAWRRLAPKAKNLVDKAKRDNKR